MAIVNPEDLGCVYDRTQSDIDNKTDRAYFNMEDWNRISANIVLLGESIPCFVTDTTSSSTEIIPREENASVSFSLINDNLRMIRESYPINLPPFAETFFLNFTWLNEREKFIYDTYKTWYENELAKPYCGEFYCGEYGLL